MKIVLSFLATILTLPCFATSNDTIYLLVKIKDQPRFPETYEIKLKHPSVETKALLKDRSAKEKILCLVHQDDDLLIEYELDFEKSLPIGYNYSPIRLKIPISEIGKTNTVVMAPIKVDLNKLAQEVVRLNSTDLKVLSIEGLFTFYQRAKVICEKRMENLQNNWDNLHDYDVQSVFKYLECNRELSLHGFLTPSEDINTALDWFSEVIAKRLDRVKKAIGSESAAKQIVSQIRELEGYRFSMLWNMISSFQNSEERYWHIKQYYNDWKSIPDQGKRNLVESVTQVSELAIVLSLAQNLVLNSKKNIFRQECASVIKMMETVRLTLKDQKEKDNLNSNLAYIKNLQLSLK